MNGKIVSKDNIQTTPPTWQHPVLPAPYTQGNILMTVNEGTTPIEDSSNLKWFKMEDVIGIANVKMEYDPEALEYKLWKTKGHLDNNGEWHYEWELVGKIDGLDPELKNLLESIKYVEYTYTTTYSTTTGGHLIVKGIRKDKSEDTLCDIQFITPSVFSEAVAEISNAISSETTRATTAEQQLASDLSSETTRATTAEQQLASDLSSETTRATTAEQQLASDLTAETTRATAAEQQLSSDLTAERTRATAAEQQLDNKIETLKPLNGIGTTLEQKDNGREISIKKTSNVNGYYFRNNEIVIGSRSRQSQTISPTDGNIQVMLENNQVKDILIDVHFEFNNLPYNNINNSIFVSIRNGEGVYTNRYATKYSFNTTFNKILLFTINVRIDSYGTQNNTLFMNYFNICEIDLTTGTIKSLSPSSIRTAGTIYLFLDDIT